MGLLNEWFNSPYFISQVSDDPAQQLTGLVMKKLTHHNSTVQIYKGMERELMLLADSQDLILPNVMLQDAGRYRCFLSAPLGHHNQEGDVHLRVYGECNDMKTHTFNVVSNFTDSCLKFWILLCCMGMETYTAIYSRDVLSYLWLYSYRLISPGKRT